MSGRRVVLLGVMFFLGFASSPPSFNFWNWIGEAANDPEFAVPVFYGSAILLVLAAVVFVAKNWKE